MQSPQPETRRYQNTLRVMLVLTLLITPLFLALNLHLGAIFLASLNLALILISVGLLVMMRRRVSAEPLALVYLLVLFSSVACGLARQDIHPNPGAWITVFPVLPYLLLGARLAPWVASFGFLVGITGYLVGQRVSEGQLDFQELAHLMAPTLGLFVISHFYIRSRSWQDGQMLKRLMKDPLTLLWTREKLVSEFEYERQRARRTGIPLSLFLIDLDHFKKLNDHYGHQAGDAALEFVARLFEERLRETDLLCRIGGEEFVVLLPDTDLAGAMTIAEDLRQSLTASVFHYRGESISLTLSAGVVELGRDGDDWPQLYCVADARLYMCKARGRNCIIGNLDMLERPAKTATMADHSD